jgi:DNA end-binding protein Ku
MVDEQTGRVVDKDHKGRGYEISKGPYVEIDEEELDAVKLDSTHTIEIDDFVPAEDIDERYLDNPITLYQMVRRVPMRLWSFATP